MEHLNRFECGEIFSEDFLRLVVVSSNSPFYCTLFWCVPIDYSRLKNYRRIVVHSRPYRPLLPLAFTDIHMPFDVIIYFCSLRHFEPLNMFKCSCVWLCECNVISIALHRHKSPFKFDAW